MNKNSFLIRTGNAALAAVLGLSPVTGLIQPLVVQAEIVSAPAKTVDNTGETILSGSMNLAPASISPSVHR